MFIIGLCVSHSRSALLARSLDRLRSQYITACVCISFILFWLSLSNSKIVFINSRLNVIIYLGWIEEWNSKWNSFFSVRETTHSEILGAMEPAREGDGEGAKQCELPVYRFILGSRNLSIQMLPRVCLYKQSGFYICDSFCAINYDLNHSLNSCLFALWHIKFRLFFHLQFICLCIRSYSLAFWSLRQNRVKWNRFTNSPFKWYDLEKFAKKTNSNNEKKLILTCIYYYQNWITFLKILVNLLLTAIEIKLRNKRQREKKTFSTSFVVYKNKNETKWIWFVELSVWWMSCVMCFE